MNMNKVRTWLEEYNGVNDSVSYNAIHSFYLALENIVSAFEKYTPTVRADSEAIGTTYVASDGSTLECCTHVIEKLHGFRRHER